MGQPHTLYLLPQSQIHGFLQHVSVSAAHVCENQIANHICKRELQATNTIHCRRTIGFFFFSAIHKKILATDKMQLRNYAGGNGICDCLWRMAKGNKKSFVCSSVMEMMCVIKSNNAQSPWWFLLLHLLVFRIYNFFSLKQSLIWYPYETCHS